MDIVGDISLQQMQRIISKFPSQQNDLRPNEPNFTGFCRFINFQQTISNGVRDLLSIMLIAAFKSYDLGAPCSRTVGLVLNTHVLIIKDAYVGVLHLNSDLRLPSHLSQGTLTLMGW